MSVIFGKTSFSCTQMNSGGFQWRDLTSRFALASTQDHDAYYENSEPLQAFPAGGTGLGGSGQILSKLGNVFLLSASDSFHSRS